MKNLEDTVCKTVLKLARRRQKTRETVAMEQSLIADLGLESLDIAELVATLELATGKDPFAKDVAIVSIKTVGDLCRAYAS